MRLSVDQDDSGYTSWRRLHDAGKIVRVFLDEVEVKNCSTADDEGGFVITAVLDDEGQLQLDPQDQCRVWEEIRRGKVRFEIRDKP